MIFFYLNPDLRLLLPFWSINHEIALLAQKNAWHQEWSLLLLKLKTIFKTFKIRTAAGLCIIWWNKTDLYAKRGLNDLCDDFRYCYACVYHIIIHFKQTFMQCIARTERKSSVQFKSSFFGELWTELSSLFQKRTWTELKFNFLVNLNWTDLKFSVHFKPWFSA